MKTSIIILLGFVLGLSAYADETTLATRLAQRTIMTLDDSQKRVRFSRRLGVLLQVTPRSLHQLSEEEFESIYYQRPQTARAVNKILQEEYYPRSVVELPSSPMGDYMARLFDLDGSTRGEYRGVEGMIKFAEDITEVSLNIAYDDVREMLHLPFGDDEGMPSGWMRFIGTAGDFNLLREQISSAQSIYEMVASSSVYVHYLEQCLGNVKAVLSTLQPEDLASGHTPAEVVQLFPENFVSAKISEASEKYRNPEGFKLFALDYFDGFTADAYGLAHRSLPEDDFARLQWGEKPLRPRFFRR